MELTFTFYVEINKNSEKKHFTVDYDITKQDLEEFARQCDFDNAVDLLVSGVRHPDEDDVKEIKDELERCPHCLDVYLDDHSKNLFREFLVNKYQDKVATYVLENLTCDMFDLELDLNK